MTQLVLVAVLSWNGPVYTQLRYREKILNIFEVQHATWEFCNDKNLLGGAKSMNRCRVKRHSMGSERCLLLR